MPSAHYNSVASIEQANDLALITLAAGEPLLPDNALLNELKAA